MSYDLKGGHNTSMKDGQMPSANEPPKWYNKTYSYPDGVGSLLIEGPFP